MLSFFIEFLTPQNDASHFLTYHNGKHPNVHLQICIVFRASIQSAFHSSTHILFPSQITLQKITSNRFKKKVNSDVHISKTKTQHSLISTTMVLGSVKYG